MDISGKKLAVEAMVMDGWIVCVLQTTDMFHTSDEKTFFLDSLCYDFFFDFL